MKIAFTAIGRKFALLFVAALCTACSADQRNADSATARAKAPTYPVLTLAGDSTSLEAQRGKVVLLNVWATWCAPCRDEIPVLQKLHESSKDRGLLVVGVSIDARGEQERIKRFLADYGVTYPIWHDPDDRVSFLFRAIGVPSTYLIDKDGSVVWRHLGPVEANDPALKAALSKALPVQ